MTKMIAPVFGIALAGMAASTASASSVTLDFVDAQDSALVSSQIDGNEVESLGEFSAGSLIFENTSTLDRILAWCLEVTKLISLNPTDYTVSHGLPDAEMERNVSRLFTGYVDQTSTAIGAAAFQLALWEIVEETDPTFDLTSGRFTAASSTAEVISTSTGFLAGLGDFDANYKITYFQSPFSQDIITAAPIPLPASVLLLGAGVGALAFAGRRRKAKAANS